MPKIERRFVVQLAFAAILVLAPFVTAPARAGAEFSPGDLAAAARALAFVDNLPQNGPLAVGVVYDAAAPNARTHAALIAAQLNSISRANSATIRSAIVADTELAQTASKFDAVLLMPHQDHAEIAELVRRRHLISISNDPACLDTNCCVLMIHSDGRVRIVLDTSLAAAAGAQFSPIFLMMVERR